MKEPEDLIEVLQKDIDRAKKEGTATNCGKCAIASAIRRAGYKDRVSVDYKELLLGNTMYRFPASIIEWQEVFAEGVDVKPFEFRISELRKIEGGTW